MHPHPPALLELQHAIGLSLRHGTDSDLSALMIADGIEPQARLAIYRNTATGTLLKALILSYPAVQALVGPEFFEGAARLFIADSPPQSAWLDAYGDAFPDFLARLPQAATLAYLPDTARLEWAVNTVLHAPDAQPLDLARLAQLDESELGHLCFEPHPAARLIRSEFPVDAIWRGVLARDDGAMAAVDLGSGPVWLLVRRAQDGAQVSRLSEVQWRFTAALLAGCPLHAALEEAPASEALTWLATLLASGCFAGTRLRGPASDPPSRDTRS